MSVSRPLRVAILAGELSGDILGADLMSALIKRFPDAEFEGIGGPRMLSAGLKSLYPQEALSVMGLIEVLPHLFSLIRARNRLRDHWLANPPDVFVGIDAPDFNLGLEVVLRQAGILTVHYVSPSVWAWKQWRLKKIAKAVDHMLTLLPFEADFYKRSDIPVTYVGHPLAEQIPLTVDQASSRALLGLNVERPVLGVLPGSRGGEVKRLGESFIQAARLCQQQLPELQVVLVPANEKREAELRAIGFPDEWICATAQASQCMAASNALMVASGTVTLEAALYKRPMVIAYRLAALTYRIARRMVKVAHIGLPNLLAGKRLVPELIQDEVTPDRIAQQLLPMLREPSSGPLREEFTALHHLLRAGGGETAADTIERLLIERGTLCR
ncbi:lipid-A-disaccharide synthase [Pokkaliibacter plantistimulans]|uniref:Lipid-A-disaccharide synthase n=1 Tax=Proteobacteria bacterium 228 TaxID=2083153 RepID=A0A2S5KKN2_9PROT|nr:lipid-A-disaccharide synthase [Pokkaliibacter plantistimulans]PPC74886.1 lipid-A-disaccharide synthase [Pokkaliibacter plantistimulans]